MKTKPGLDLRHLVIFALLGSLMFTSKQIMELFPNVHMLGMLTMVYTLVYRKLALIPIYLFVFLEGLLVAGFGLWWIPYLYLWAVLWGMTMLLPRKMPVWLQMPVYMLVCALHGLAYGTLYAPFQCYAFLGGDWSKVPAWIVAGLPWDFTHALGNLAMGTLIVPMTRLLQKLENSVSA